jgi:hypothetical protein
MTSTGHKFGTLSPVIYFERADGHIFLAPYSSFPTPPGCIKHGADTLPDIDRLQKRLNAQERFQWEREAHHEYETFDARQEEIADRLRTKMVSGSTTPFERDFIEGWLKLKDEKKRKKYKDILEQRNMYLWAREHDTPGRREDEERVDLDRLELPRG